MHEKLEIVLVLELELEFELELVLESMHIRTTTLFTPSIRTYISREGVSEQETSSLCSRRKPVSIYDV